MVPLRMPFVRIYNIKYDVYIHIFLLLLVQTVVSMHPKHSPMDSWKVMFHEVPVRETMLQVSGNFPEYTVCR